VAPPTSQGAHGCEDRAALQERCGDLRDRPRAPRRGDQPAVQGNQNPDSIAKIRAGLRSGTRAHRQPQRAHPVPEAYDMAIATSCSWIGTNYQTAPWSDLHGTPATLDNIDWHADASTIRLTPFFIILDLGLASIRHSRGWVVGEAAQKPCSKTHRPCSSRND